MTADQKMAKAAELYDANTAAARGLGAGISPFGQGAPILASRPAASPTASAPASPDDVISAKNRQFWQRRGISLPWWQSQPAAPGAPVARGILDVQGPPKPPGPGSVNSYETSHNLVNIPDVPYAAPEVLRHPMQGAAPSGGEGVDAYEQRLGLAPTPSPRPPVTIDNTPQGRSVQQYIDSLRPSAADQIAQDAKKKRLTAAQRGW